MDGNRVRKLRKQQGMTIDDLSVKSGFTSSYISQVERNLIEPSLSALSKICKVLNTSPYFFIENDEDDITITRKEDRQKLLIPENNRELQFIIPISDENKKKFKFNVFKAIINPGNWDSQKYIVIDSDKCVIINKGTLLIAINDCNELLQEGDSVYISANTPHKLYNPTDEDIEITFIISPSIY